MSAWAYLRHYLNLKILYSVLTEFTTVGPYELNWETQQYKCWIAQYITFALLASLQAVNIFWFFLIGRIAWRFVFDDRLEDERSEYDEESGGEELEGEERGKMVGDAMDGAEEFGKLDGKTSAIEVESVGARVKSRKGGVDS